MSSWNLWDVTCTFVIPTFGNSGLDALPLLTSFLSVCVSTLDFPSVSTAVWISGRVSFPLTLLFRCGFHSRGHFRFGFRLFVGFLCGVFWLQTRKNSKHTAFSTFSEIWGILDLPAEDPVGASSGSARFRKKVENTVCLLFAFPIPSSKHPSSKHCVVA